MAKVLVIDDASFVRMRIKNILGPIGHTILEAVNGANGIQMFQSENPDMVFMDVNMPEMDGLTALKEIIKINRNAKVVMLTNESQQKTIMDALQNGAKNFLVKPFDEEKLITLVNKLTS
ncbi:MAG: response regulator [Candidatus Margulisbacteria bacterium]|nr:response regulator [Candidatus Margulisiibacteriota bacterium]